MNITEYDKILNPYSANSSPVLPAVSSNNNSDYQIKEQNLDDSLIKKRKKYARKGDERKCNLQILIESRKTQRSNNHQYNKQKNIRSSSQEDKNNKINQLFTEGNQGLISQSQIQSFLSQQSPILNVQNQKKIEFLKTEYSSSFYSKFMLASRGSPKYYQNEVPSTELNGQNLKIQQKEFVNQQNKQQQLENLQTLISENKNLKKSINSQKDYKNSIKDLIPLKKEVIDLVEWLDNQLEQIKKGVDEMNLAQIIEKKQKIIQLTLLELIRQVSTESKERGQQNRQFNMFCRIFLKMIWDSFIDTVNHLIQIYNQFINTNTKEKFKEIKLLNEKYQTKLNQQKNEIEELEIQTKVLKRQIEQLNKELNYVSKKEQKLLRQTKIYQEEMKKLSSSYEKLMKQYTNLMMKHYDLDWKTVCEMNNYHQIDLDQFLDINDIEKQVKNEIKIEENMKNKQENDLRKLLNNYIIDLQEKKDDDQYYQDFRQDENLISDKKIDTFGLIQTFHQGCETKDLIQTEDFSQSFQPHSNTKFVQTIKLLFKNQSTQFTFVKETDTESTQTDFPPIIIYQDKVIEKQPDQESQMKSNQRKKLLEVKAKLENQMDLSQILEDPHYFQEEDKNNFLKDLQTLLGLIILLLIKLDLNDKELILKHVIKELEQIEKKEKEQNDLINQYVITIEKNEFQLNEKIQIIDSLQNMQKESAETIENEQGNLSITFKQDINTKEDNQQLTKQSIESSQSLRYEKSKKQKIQRLASNFSNEISLKKDRQMKQSSEKKKVPKLQVPSIQISNPSSPSIRSNQMQNQISSRSIMSHSKPQNDRKNYRQSFFVKQRQEHNYKSQNFQSSTSLFLDTFSKVKQGQKQEIKSQTAVNLLKTLQLVVADLIKQNKKNEKIINPLHVLIYDHFFHKFGLRNVAEKNYVNLIQNLYQLHEENDYFKIFSQLIFTKHLIQSNNLDTSDLMKNQNNMYNDGEKIQFVLNLITMLDESNQRNTCIFDKMYTTLYKIKDSYQKWTGIFVHQSQVEQLTDEMENGGIQIMQQINLFPLIAKILDLSEILLSNFEKNQKVILSIFGDQSVPLSVFLLIYRNLEKKYSINNQVIQEFEELSIYDEEFEVKQFILIKFKENSMNKQQFIYFCSKYQIFKAEKIEKILYNKTKKLNKSIQEKVAVLSQKFEQKVGRLRSILFQLQREFNNAHHYLIEKIRQELENHSEFYDIDILQSIVLSYKLLKLDIRQAQIENSVQILIPLEYIYLQNQYHSQVVPKAYSLMNK